MRRRSWHTASPLSDDSGRDGEDACNGQARIQVELEGPASETAERCGAADDPEVAFGSPWMNQYKTTGLTNERIPAPIRTGPTVPRIDLTLILETAVQGMTLNLTDGPARGLSLL